MSQSDNIDAKVAASSGPGILARLRRSCHGNVAVEAAFVLPVLLTFMLGAIEISRALWIKTSLQYAVARAARCAAVASTDCVDVPLYAASQVYAVSIPTTAFTYTAGATCGNTGYNSGYQVVANYTFKTSFTKILPQFGSIPLQASACHP